MPLLLSILLPKYPAECPLLERYEGASRVARLEARATTVPLGAGL
jgi:hypothetical protein